MYSSLKGSADVLSSSSLHSDLASVPEDLRGCLERCLSEDASPGVLDRHLPQVREIIVHLLQGLKQKQAEYKRLIAPVQKPVSSRSHGGPAGASRAASIGQRDSRSILQGMSGGSSRTASGTASPDSSSYHDGSSVTTRTFTPSTQRTSSSHTFDGDEESPPTPTKASAKGGSSSSTGPRMLPVDIPSSALSEEFSPSDSPATSRMVPSPSMSRLASPRSVKPSLGTVGESEAGTAMDVTDADPSLRALKSRDALERRASKRFSAYTFNKMGVGQPFGQNNFGSQTLGMSTLGTASNQASPNADKRAERRARKNKAEALDDRPSPRSAPAMPNRSQSNSVDHLSEPSEAYPSRARAKDPSTPSRSGKSTVTPTTSSLEPLPDVNADQEAATTTLGVSGIPPVPPLPSSEETARLSATHDFITKQQGSRITSGSSDRTLGARDSGTASGLAPPFSQVTPTREAEVAPPAEPSEVQIFLQLGRQTRKTSLEAGSEISIGRLRMLFVDRFAYSPGQDDFPTIYIKDPHSGVSYELEDLGDITSGCMLTLNIEPLDQVKQHLDISLGTISKELREVKQALQEQKERETALLASRRFSSTPMLAAATFPPASPNKFSDSQFAAAGQRVASLQQRRPSAGPAASIPADKARTTSSSPSSASSGARIAGDLKAHYEEVLNLRRDMAILQQLQGDFSGDVGGLLKAMKEQSAKVRAIAATEVPTERNFILAGKSKLDGNSQEVLTLIEDLQDIVDDLKLDVIQRGVKPKPATLKKISGDIDRATQGLEDLEKYVQTVKPSWKKTWESELQNIVDEQEFLNHQESLISDLRDDHSALQEVYENIQQVVKLRSAGRPTGGKYIPPLPEEGHEGLSSVMFEVKGQQIDHDRRLRALQAAEKTRQREIASRTDEFTEELAGFVHGSKAPEAAGASVPIGLRKTGGHLEVERIRSKRDKATLLAMFGAGGSGGAPLEVDVQKPKKLLIPVGGGSAAAAAGKAVAGKAASTASPSSLASAISTSDSEAGKMLTVGGPTDGSTSSHGSSLARTAEEGEEDEDERSGDVNGDLR